MTMTPAACKLLAYLADGGIFGRSTGPIPFYVRELAAQDLVRVHGFGQSWTVRPTARGLGAVTR